MVVVNNCLWELCADVEGWDFSFLGMGVYCPVEWQKTVQHNISTLTHEK